MRIIVNGEPTDVGADTLDALLTERGLADAVVATALNREFVPVVLRGDARLRDGDAVEIIAPMQGG